MSLPTLRRPALLLAIVFAVAVAALFLISTPTEAADVKNVDMKLTFGEDKGVGDGVPNDAIFKVHDSKNNGIAGIRISVRYVSNGTEIVNLTTDAAGLAQLLNLSQDNYTYYAYDQGVLFGWGSFWVNASGSIGHGHAVFIMNGDAMMDDFSFGVKQNEGAGYNESWVEIWDFDLTQILWSGYANSNDPHGDSWVRAFIKQNLSAGKYWFEAWDNSSRLNWLQNGTFYIGFEAWFWGWEWFDVDWDYDYYNETKTTYFDVNTNSEVNTTLIVDIYVYDSNETFYNYTRMYINVTGDDFDRFWFNFTANFSDYYWVWFYLYAEDGKLLYDNFTIIDNWLEVEYEAWFYSWEWWDYDLDRDGYKETKQIYFDIDTNTANKTTLYVYMEVYDSNGTLVVYRWYQYNVSGYALDSFVINYTTNFSDWYSVNITLVDEYLTYDWDNFTIIDNWLEVEYDSWFYYWYYYDYDWDEDGYYETKQVYFDIDTNTANRTMVIVDIEVYDSNGTEVNYTRLYLNVTGEDSDSFVFNYTTEFSDWYTVNVTLYGAMGLFRYDNFTIHDNWLEVEFEAWFYYYEWWDEDEDQDGYYETKFVYFDIDTNTANMTQLWVTVEIYDSNESYVDDYELSYYVNGTDWDMFSFSWNTTFSDWYSFYFTLENTTYYEWDNFTIIDNWLEVEFDTWFYSWDYEDIDYDEDGYKERKVIWFDIDTNTANETQVWILVEIYNSNDTLAYTTNVSYNVSGDDLDTQYFNISAPFSDWYTFEMSLWDSSDGWYDNFTIHDNWLQVEFEAYFDQWWYVDMDKDYDGYNETKVIWFDIDTNTTNTTQLWVEVFIFDSNGTKVDYYELSYYIIGDEDDDFYFNWSTEFSDNYTVFLSLQNVTYYEWDNISIYYNWLEVEFNASFYDWEWWDLDWDEDGYKETKLVWFDIDTNTALNRTLWVEVYVFNSDGHEVDYYELHYNVSGIDVDNFYFNWSAELSDNYTFLFSLQDIDYYEFHNFTIVDNWLELEFEAYFYDWSYEDLDWDEDGYYEMKSVWFDIDTNTANLTQLWVEVYVHDSNGTEVDYYELSYYINGTQWDYFYFNWSTEFSDNYTFNFSLQNVTYYEYDNFTIYDNWLEVAFDAWYYDWDYEDLDWDQDGFKETKSIWFDIDTNTSKRSKLWVDVEIYKSNGTRVALGNNISFNVTGMESEYLFFNISVPFSDWYDFHLHLYDDNGVWYDVIIIYDNWLQDEFEAWFGTYWYGDVDLDEDGYNETKSLWFDIDTNTANRTTLWLEILVFDSNSTMVDYQSLMYDVYGIDNDDFWFNWTTEFSDNYTFYYYLLNETDYEWDNITIWDNWLEVEFETYFYDWEYYDIDYDEDGYNETKLVWFDIDTNTALNETVHVWVMIEDSNGTYVDELYLDFNVTGIDIDNFYFYWETEFSDAYNFTFLLLDWMYYPQDEFNITMNWLEVEFEAWFYDWYYYDLDWDQDGYYEMKSVWFDIDTNTSVMTTLYVEVIVEDSNGSMVGYDYLAYNITGEDWDDLYFNWSTEFSDNYTFYVYLYNETGYEWENFTIYDNWLEVEFNATFYDWMYWDIDDDEDGYNETKLVWFDIDTNTALNRTVYVDILILDSNESYVDTFYLEFNVTGRDLDNFYFAWATNFSDDYTFYIEMFNESYDYMDGFGIYENWLEVEFDAWFAYDYWFHEDYDGDGFNETKYVIFDIDINTSRKTEVYVEVNVYDSNGTLVETEYIDLNVSGKELSSEFFMWAANFSDSYTFEFDLYNASMVWFDNFTIEDNWLEVEFDAWFWDWDYEDLDHNEDSFVEMKSVWFDINTNTSNRTSMYVLVRVYNSTDDEAYAEFLYMNVTGEEWDRFYFNWSAEYNDTYTFEVYLYHSNDTFYHKFFIEDNWLEVPYEYAWFEDKDYDYYDLEGDEFEESLNWTFDVDTWNNFTQEGWILIEIYNDTGDQVQEEYLDYLVTGEDPTDILYWNWSAEYTDWYTFNISIWDYTYDIWFHRQTHDIYLEVVYEWAWFEDKEYDLYDEEGDEFEETINWTFDVDTWKNYVQNGWVYIDIYNSTGDLVTNISLMFEITGEDPTDMLYWNWSASYSDLYTFNITIWSYEYTIEFHNQTHDIYLEVVYEWAWFEDKEWDYYDEEDDGANESINWTFDVDTWIGHTQQGWIVIEVYNLSGLVAIESVEFMVTGQDPTDIVYFNWTATVTDTYSFVIHIWDYLKVVEFHNQTHDDIELEIFVGNRIPIATIDDIEPDPADQDATVYFNGTGMDYDGTIVAYEWYIEGILASTDEDFTIGGVVHEVGTWEIKFRVKDDTGAWSENVTATITVRDSIEPKLGLLVEPDYDNGKLTITVKADEDIYDLNVTVEFTSARAADLVAMTPAADGDKRNYTGTYDSIDAGDYEVVAKGKDAAGNHGTTTTTATIEQVTAKRDEPTVVDNKDTTGTKLEINTKNDTSGKVSVSKTSAPAPVAQDQAEAGVKELGLYVSIDIDDAILDELDYVNITMYYSDDEIPADVKEESLVLFHYVESTDEWVKADPTGVNMVDNYVWGHVSDFSVFAIFGSNVAPTADAGSDMNVKVNTEVTFDGSASDLDGTVVLYEWDFDGDGTYDASNTNGTATHTYTTEGDYTAKLRVTDDQGATGFDEITVKVTKSGDGDDDDDGGFIPGFPLALSVVALAGVAALARRSRPQL